MEGSQAGWYSHAKDTTSFLRAQLPKQLQKPSVGVICGSGLSGLANSIQAGRERMEFDYKTIPHFPQSTVVGHAGKLLFGFMGESSRVVVLMVGRLHFYEGHSIHDVTFPIRVMKLLGVNYLIATNAAGGLNESFEIGDFMIIGDHLNLAGLTGVHPLRGPNVDELGTRFPALSDAYDLELRRISHRIWKNISSDTVGKTRSLHEGVYAYVGGPSYETRAECRMLRLLGADVVGMSTVPEVVVARHCGIRVLAISLVTNKVVHEAGPRGDDPTLSESDANMLAVTLGAGKADHEDVLQAGVEAAKDMQHLVYGIVDSIPIN